MMPAIAAAVMMTAVNTASAQEAEPSQPGFLDQLFGGSDRLGNGDRPVQAGPQNRIAQAPGPDVVRLERLEYQLRQLTGAIEQLQYRNQQLENQLRRFSEDTELRFQDLRPGVPTGRQPTPTAQRPVPMPQAGAAPTGRRNDAFDPTQNPSAPGAPRPMGTTAPSAPLVHAPEADEDPTLPGGRVGGVPLDLASREHTGVGEAPPSPRTPGGTQLAAVPPTDSPKDSFDLAYGYLVRKEYALADESLRGFLRRFPNDRLAPDAQYWLGESLFQRQRYRDAAESFLDVSTRYESTAKAPDALLRLGQSLAALGEKEAACASLAEVGRKYPRAAVAVKQGVDREQRRVRC